MINRRELISYSLAGAGLSIAGVPMAALAQQTKGTINVMVQPEPSGLMLGIVQNGPTQLGSGYIY